MRAAFARALALDPKILFLDEPTSDLDPIAAGGIDALIRQLNDSLGVTVVIVTHDLTTLFTVCGRIAVLVDRKVIVDTADKLMKSEHPWIHEFFHGPRAEGAMKGDEMNSSLRARANSEGGRKARNEILIVIAFFESKTYL